MATEDDREAFAWLATEGAESSPCPQETLSGAEAVEADTWASPARLLLQERSERNRHPDGCACVRCQPLKHGSYAQIGEEARELAESLAALLPDPHASDSLAVELLATAVLRTRRAMLALETADEQGRLEDALRLSADARGWLSRAQQMAERLGLTPTSRAGLGLAEAETARHRVAAVLGAVDVSRWSEDELQAVERLLLKATPEPER